VFLVVRENGVLFRIHNSLQLKIRHRKTPAR